MNKIQLIANPMLISAMELMKKENTPSSRRVFIDEVLHATFLSPVIVTQPDVKAEGEEGKPSPANKISVPMLTGPDGKRYFMAFTDVAEMKKVKKENPINVLPFEFKDYAVMIAKADENCNGFVINPFSNGPIVGKDLVVSIVNTSIKKNKSAQNPETEPAAEAEE